MACIRSTYTQVLTSSVFLFRIGSLAFFLFFCMHLGNFLLENYFYLISAKNDKSGTKTGFLQTFSKVLSAPFVGNNFKLNFKCFSIFPVETQFVSYFVSQFAS